MTEPQSQWRHLKHEPPNPQDVWDGNVIVRRQWNTKGTVPKRLYDYKALERGYVIDRALSRGWVEWLKMPE